MASRLFAAPLVLVMLVGPPLAHLALVFHRGTALAGILIAMQAVAVTWVVSSPIERRTLRVCACVAIFLAVLFLWQLADDGAVLASAVPHAMIYGSLLAVFAMSLLPGRESVATMFARISRGHLSVQTARYTRRVTWAWCWFFGAQLVGSMLLLLFAPLGVWSLFINVCNLPLIGAMLITEYLYRQWRYAAQPPERLIDMIRLYRRITTEPVREDRS